jgi:phosphoglucomutase
MSRADLTTLHSDQLSGERIEQVLDHAAIGGIKGRGKPAARGDGLSGNEAIYKIYAESFIGKEHLQRVLKEAQGIVDAALA